MSDLRERFEEWAVKQGINLARFDRYRYADNEAKAAWVAWQAACPEGWQCVPKEPTGEMLDRAWADCGIGGRQDYIESYKAMLAAAPKPEDV